MSDNKIHKFNIRVYGLFLNAQAEILLADEERFGMKMTKFPGGGLQFGEGTIDCLKRESLEEFGQEVEVGEHFYTTDFYQKARFYDDQQLISIYYYADFCDTIQFPLATKAFDFKDTSGDILSFRFEKIGQLKPTDLSFPIDRHVLQLLQEKYRLMLR